MRAPRVFALVTATPSAEPGQEVTVEAVWYDPLGPREPPAGFLWRVCPALQDPRGCALASQGSTLDSTGPSARLPGATMDRDVYLALCPSGVPSLDPLLGHARCASGPALETLRTVRVDPAPTRNHNPSIERFQLVQGATRRALGPTTVLAREPCAGADCALGLELQPSPDSAETVEGSPERLVVNFFTTVGVVEPSRVDSGAFRAVWRGSAPDGAAVRVWAVLRDGRGGVAVGEGRFSP